MDADLHKRAEELRTALEAARAQEDADWHALAEGGSIADFEGENGERIRAHFDGLAHRGYELRAELERTEAALRERET